MKTPLQQAKDSLVKLVEHVFAHRDGLIAGITYEELAARIGRVNKHGTGHAHGMGGVLGKMGHLLKGLAGEWGEEPPHIQSLVVQKSGKGKNLPDDGIKAFWPDYPKMSRVEKENRTRIEHQRVVDFGSRWNDVLTKLSLPNVTTQSAARTAAKSFGAGGESAKHKELKEFIRSHPELVGATSIWKSFVEYPLPSLDAIDVLFKSDQACIAVEVKSVVSDAFPSDYERGIYQAVKYGALLKAMSLSASRDIPCQIQSVLVLESDLPDQYRKLAEVLGVTVFESVKTDAP